MRPIWLCMGLAGAMLALSLGSGAAWAGGPAGGHGGGFGGGRGGIHGGGGLRYGLGPRRFGLPAHGYGGRRFDERRFGRGFGERAFDRRFGRHDRDYGGFGYGGFGGSSTTFNGGDAGGERRSEPSGYPVALGIRPAPTRAPTTYVVGGRRDFATARRGTMNRSGGGSLVADSEQAGGVSGADAARPRVVRVP